MRQSINRQRVDESSRMFSYEFDSIITDDSLTQEYRQIKTDELDLHFYKSNRTKERETYVYRDLSYIQMHYELSNGYTAYQSKHESRAAVRAESGKCTTFYLPELDGYLYDPVCKNAVSFEIEITEKWLRSNLSESSKSSYEFLKRMSNKEIAVLGKGSYSISPEMRQLIYEINTCSYTGLVRQLYVEGKVMLLLGLQLHQIECGLNFIDKEGMAKSDLDRYYYLRELLTTEYNVKHSIEELSLRIGINRTKLQSGFKQCFGLTIHEYLIEVRMNEAYRLLRDAPKGSYSVVDIATQVGYKHYNHFSFMFKKKFGVSPSAFM